MTDTETIKQQTIEMRETAKRFGWLCLVLAIIWLVVYLAHQPVEQFLQKHSLTAQKPAAATSGLVARR
jgi:hypothetical protein